MLLHHWGHRGIHAQSLIPRACVPVEGGGSKQENNIGRLSKGESDYGEQGSGKIGHKKRVINGLNPEEATFPLTCEVPGPSGTLAGGGSATLN